MKRTQNWKRTKIPNLFLLVETGNYYMRVKPKGAAQKRESLHTDNFTVARERLRQRLLELQHVKGSGGGTWGSLKEPWKKWLKGERVKGAITQSTIDYKLAIYGDVEKRTWPGWVTEPLADLSEKNLAAWLVVCRRKYCATRTNGAITILREMLALAVRDKLLARERVEEALHGLSYCRVDYDYKRMTLQLPEPATVAALRMEIYRRCHMAGTKGAWLFDFLLFSGVRRDSACHVLREDVHREKGLLYVRQAKRGAYSVPLFPELLTLIDSIEKQSPGKPTDRLLTTNSVLKVIDVACKTLGIVRINHHSLRHLFATRCIEAGVDIPTVASWLGHRDGGKTAMKVYGHLRQEHSQALAKTMQFLPAQPGTNPKKELGVEKN